jgi:hypothetical protein
MITQKRQIFDTLEHILDSNESIKSRLLKFLEENNIEKGLFFDKLGISSSNFRGVAKKSEIGGEILAKIAFSYPQLSLEWLITGNGNMLNDKKLNASLKHINKNIMDKIYPEIYYNKNSEVTLIESIQNLYNVKNYFILPNFDFIKPDFIINHNILFNNNNTTDKLLICKLIHNWNDFIINEQILVITNSSETYFGYLEDVKINKSKLLVVIQDNEKYAIDILNILRVYRIVGEIIKY